MLYREAGQFKTSYDADQAMFPIIQDRWFVAALIAVAYLVVPFVASEYWLQAVLIPFLVFSMAAIGLNLLLGYAGQLSLGTGAFMAVGAYATYKLATAFPDLNIVVVFLLAGVVTAGVGLIFGTPSLRIEGFYLAAIDHEPQNLRSGVARRRTLSRASILRSRPWRRSSS